MEAEAVKRRRGRRERGAGAAPGTGRTGPLRNVLKPIEPMSADQVEAVHAASLRLLEEVGVEFMGAAARRALRAAGASVEEASGNVRFPRGLVEEVVTRAPPSFTLTPRNPARRLEVGGNGLSFSLVAGPPFVHDRVNGRRSGNHEDYVRLVRLAQSFDVIHYVGNQPTAPQELPAETRHLDCYLANLVNTDRVYHCSAIGRERALDGIDMMAISRGLTREQMVDDPGVLTVINVNSPRRFDEAMSDGLMTMSEWGQPVIVTPFTLMGAMTPVTLSAALVQQNAEALAGIALAQVTRPGAPVVYGAFTSNVDLKSGAPAFGTPENVRATLAAGQLARRYRLPYRASNASASNAVDAQAAYESLNSLWAAVMGGANLVYHGAGWMEGGLTASFEKVVLDVELLSMMAEIVQPMAFDDIEEGLAAIAEVPTGGHFFGSPHTLARYANAFYAPILSDWRNHESWLEAGAPDAAERATRIWQRKLEAYEEPPMEPGVREALDAFVAGRKAGPAGGGR